MERSFEMEDSGRQEHRRSMSDPESGRWQASNPRNVVITVPRYMQQDRMGVMWGRHAVIDENFLPTDDREYRSYMANQLGTLGYGDRHEFKTVQAFVFSLPRLVRTEDLDFVMDSRVWNFLMACWVKDSDRGGRFDFGMAASIRNDIIKRRASLVRDVMVQKNVDEYGREMFSEEDYEQK